MNTFQFIFQFYDLASNYKFKNKIYNDKDYHTNIFGGA